MNDKMFSIRISEKLLEEYRMFCDEHSINMSKRLRRYMERDIKEWKLKKLQKKKSLDRYKNNNI